MKKTDIVYIYENHIGGGLYITDEEQDYDELYCETCGDSDTLVAFGYVEDIIAGAEDEVEQANQRLAELKELLKCDDTEG